jgi:hypothetical protein
MRYFRIKEFSGIQNQRSGSDEDRGTLKMLTNSVPSPKGTVSSAPQWGRVYLNAETQAGKVQSFTDVAANRVVTYTNASGVTTAIAVPVTAGFKAAPTGSVSNMVATDHTLTGVGMSGIGPEIFIGDGVGDNLRIGEDTNWAPALLSPPMTGRYTHSLVGYPACTTFVVGPDHAVYAAGNAEAPTTVWVSEPVDISSGISVSHGIQSAVLSPVELALNNATKITGLSTFRDYVVVHTDVGVVLLYRTQRNQAGTGYRVKQTASPTHAGAANPSVVSNALGVAPYYLGTDGQIYRDEAARAGLQDKMEVRGREVATWKAISVWDTDINGVSDAFAAFEPGTSWYLAAVDIARKQSYGGLPWFLYSGDTNTISGPHLYPQFTAVCSLPGSPYLLAVDALGDFWSTNLDDVREQRNLPPTSSNISTAAPRVTIRIPADVEHVLATENNEVITNEQDEMLLIANPQFGAKFSATDALEGLIYEGPFSDGAISSEIMDGSIFHNSVLAVVETSFEDFKAPEQHKHFMELLLKFNPDSIGYCGVFIETEDGLTAGRWLGDISTRDTWKTFFNIRGRQLRIRLYVVTDLNNRWVLNDLAIGYMLQNTL